MVLVSKGCFLPFPNVKRNHKDFNRANGDMRRIKKSLEKAVPRLQDNLVARKVVVFYSHATIWQRLQGSSIPKDLTY